MPISWIRQTGRPLWRKALVWFLLAAGVAGGGYYLYTQYGNKDESAAAGRDGRRGPPGGGRPQPVSVAEVKTQDLPVWINALGTAVPRNLVTVRSRVDGELMKLHFREGQMVKQGQLIAEIDPRPFQVQLLSANGQLARDAALLANAQIDLQRYKDLWAKDSIARQQVDTQEALVRQYQGSVEVDRAQVESAKLQLVYARVVAPVSGRIGLRTVDPGNQVHASDPLGLAVVAQLQPMTVVFSVPESHLPAISQRLGEAEPIRVEAWDREQKNRLAVGRLLTTDNLVDSATGTIKLKAAFRNEKDELFPNQFVNVRLLAGLRQGALAVPGAAILRGSKGPFVYVADGEDKVSAVPVVPGPVDRDMVAVEGALKPGMRVVTDGADKLREGAKVEVIAARARGEGAAAAKGGDRRGKRREGGGPPGGAKTEAGAAPPAATQGAAEAPRRPEGASPPAAN